MGTVYLLDKYKEEFLSVCVNGMNDVTLYSLNLFRQTWCEDS